MEPQRKKATALHTCEPCRRTVPYRIYAVVHTCGIMALMYRHAHAFLHARTLVSSLFFVADLVLAFMWANTTSLRLTPVRRSEFPENYKPEGAFPGIDVFVCTADPYKEPPTMVANTVLSLMAYDYPSDQISVYVSDDGGSSLTLFALLEAAKFSKLWLPFCKNNHVLDRSPDAYFASDSHSWTDEAHELKIKYEEMKKRVEDVVEIGQVGSGFISSDHEREFFLPWTHDISRHNHPSIIQVLVDSKVDKDGSGNAMPNLIYVSREKSSASPHHFKAGALNTLLRVSGVMTNSPIVLNVDCDMYSNDPKSPLRALCYLSDPKLKPELGFVQYPQRFKGVDKKDIYACLFKRLFELNLMGFDGLMGPGHVGTGCFFNRRVFFGGPRDMVKPEIEEVRPYRIPNKPIKAHEVLALAHKVAGCNYEHNTDWGFKLGFRYGTLVEDYYTGYRLQCEGWRSVFCNPKRAAFCGDVPMSLIDVVSQQKRWVIGLLEMAFSSYSPITYGVKSIGLLMALGYSINAFWGTWPIPLTIYGVLPPLALLHGVSVFPKASDPWFMLYIFLFLGAYGQDLLDHTLVGVTVERWWSDQRMWMIRGLSSFFFGLIEFSLKTLKISTFGFNVTSKVGDDEQRKMYEQDIIDFGASSPLFLPMVTGAILNLLALAWGLFSHFAYGGRGGGELVLELLLASFVVVNCVPLYEAMVMRKDKGKLPKRVSCFAGVIAFVLYVLGYFFFK